MPTEVTPLTFRVKPSRGSRLYFTVRIFRTVGTMRRFHAAEVRQSAHFYRRAQGACSYWTYVEKRQAEIGIISLWRGRLGVEVVSHECTHAGLAVLGRRGVLNLRPEDIGSDHAEMLCYATGYLVREIYSRIYAAGLIVEGRAA